MHARMIARMATTTRWQTMAALMAVAIATGAAAAQSGRVVPWNIDTKPMPKGADLEILLPRTVGDFTRDALPNGAVLKSDEDLVIVYRSGRESVDVGLSRADTVADVREAFNVTRDEARRSGADLKRERRSLDADPRYFTVGDFAAWSRDRYFFFVKARSADTLDRFMRAFPF
jgi:hypothetical protein